MNTQSTPGAPAFVDITEKPGDLAHREQLSALVTRYALAAEQARGGDVLEVACGAGVGLGMLAANARSVTAGDIDAVNLRSATDAYATRATIKLQLLDACRMEFPDGSFDEIVIFEALYYLPDVQAFLQTCRRILRPGGRLVLSMVNKEWHGFNPSIGSVRYYTVRETQELFGNFGFTAAGYAAFEDAPRSLIGKLSRPLRRIAAALRLIPKTMRGKAFLKRVFYGRLVPIPSCLSPQDGRHEPLVRVDETTSLQNFKYVYVVGVKA